MTYQELSAAHDSYEIKAHCASIKRELAFKEHGDLYWPHHADGHKPAWKAANPEIVMALLHLEALAINYNHDMIVASIDSRFIEEEIDASLNIDPSEVYWQHRVAHSYDPRAQVSYTNRAKEKARRIKENEFLSQPKNAKEVEEFDAKPGSWREKFDAEVAALFQASHKS